MKRSAALLCALFLLAKAFSQVLTGTISNKTTGEKISGAAVYFNGTSQGTLSGQNGNFRIDVTRFRAMPLTVSAIGYFSATLTEFTTEKPLEILLDPKLFELDEVVVNARSSASQRRKNMTIFKNEFIGTSANALSCKILNDEDIRFIRSKDGDTLFAFSRVPLQIHNEPLGYEITYYLDYFRYSQKSRYVSYKGNALYNEDSATDQDIKRSVERRRRACYMGSRMHFFRTLWMDDLASMGFNVYNEFGNKIDPKKLIEQSDQNSKYFNSKYKIGVSYYNFIPSSYIRFLGDMVRFDSNGWFDADAIIWEGEMARQRIADALPFDYMYVQ